MSHELQIDQSPLVQYEDSDNGTESATSDEVDFQVSNGTTEDELTAQGLIKVFLAKDPNFRPLCEKTLAQISKRQLAEDL